MKRVLSLGIVSVALGPALASIALWGLKWATLHDTAAPDLLGFQLSLGGGIFLFLVGLFVIARLWRKIRIDT